MLELFNLNENIRSQKQNKRTVMEGYKNFSQKDLEFAQQIAKLNLHKEKEVETLESAEEGKTLDFKIDLDQNDKKLQIDSKSTSKKEQYKPGSVIIGKHKRYREGSMRVKQIKRIAYDMLRLMESLEKKSKIKTSLPFTTPLELKKKEKRWQDYINLARRSLYTLRREINHLSIKITAPIVKLQDNLLRSLASSSRSCYLLLKGFENFEHEIRIGEKGNLFLREVLLAAQQILFIISIGGSFPSEDVIPYAESITESSFEIAEDTQTKSVEIMTSDMDNSRVTALLNPRSVRKKLSSLAHNFKVKQKAKPKQMKYISPLNQELTSSEGNHLYPFIEDLGDGRKIQFVNDNLSPKLRKRLGSQSKGKKYYFTDKRNTKNSDSSQAEGNTGEGLETPVSADYGVSEQMADAVFEKILPYINGNEEKFSEEPNEGKIGMNMEIYVYLEAQKKLNELQERFDKLERATNEQKELLATISSGLSKSHSKSYDVLDLDEAIRKANICLEKCSKHVNTFPYQESSVDVIVDNLIKTQIHEEPNRILQEASEFPCMQNEVEALKVEFWNNLMKNKIIHTSASAVEKIPAGSPVQDFVGLEIGVNDKKLETNKERESNSFKSRLHENGRNEAVNNNKLKERNIPKLPEQIKSLVVSEAANGGKRDKEYLEDSSIYTYASDVSKGTDFSDSSHKHPEYDKIKNSKQEENPNLQAKDSSNQNKNIPVSIEEIKGSENSSKSMSFKYFQDDSKNISVDCEGESNENSQHTELKSKTSIINSEATSNNLTPFEKELQAESNYSELAEALEHSEEVSQINSKCSEIDSNSDDDENNSKSSSSF